MVSSIFDPKHQYVVHLFSPFVESSDLVPIPYPYVYIDMTCFARLECLPALVRGTRVADTSLIKLDRQPGRRDPSDLTGTNGSVDEGYCCGNSAGVCNSQASVLLLCISDMTKINPLELRRVFIGYFLIVGIVFVNDHWQYISDAQLTSKYSKYYSPVTLGRPSFSALSSSRTTSCCTLDFNCGSTASYLKRNTASRGLWSDERTR